MENMDIFSEDWIYAVASNVVGLRAVYEEALTINPPALMVNFHNLYMQGLSHVNIGTYYLIQGIDNLDSDLIALANNEFAIGTTYINQAVDLYGY